ncbi:type IV pilin protein [Neisseria musculi]|uniref:Prepilin-type N-terminal cleavage/methylation domain protein n=1 Tax=Neisseria musculi TaxID=1815583 RepID=A0A7H1M8Q1_9NEIS|nr:type IV pilin protein [Neisseria musculi]QNT58016.1 prepilin-type N-terminal cleavage/methylation domain protein [Neisseria musculi]
MQDASQKGFTLIELLAAVAVLSVLVMIAVPSYQKYIRDARLNHVRAVLLQNAHFMERFYQQRRSFKQTSTTWPALPYAETEHFCIRPQGNARGAHDGKFTLKAVAFDKSGEPRVIKINESLITVICESSDSACSDNDSFFAGGAKVDQQCKVFQ